MSWVFNPALTWKRGSADGSLESIRSKRPSRASASTDSGKKTPIEISGEASFLEVQENIMADRKAT
jgi:hypothetical protein